MSDDDEPDEQHFHYGPDPEHPGWMTWELRDDTRYNASLGKLLVRRDGDAAVVRMWPERRHSNLGDAVHGAVTLGFIDVALFAASRELGVLGVGPSVTLDLSTQFIGPGRLGLPLDARVELLRETRRLLFLRGLVEQETGLVASFAGTIRKAG